MNLYYVNLALKYIANKTRLDNFYTSIILFVILSAISALCLQRYDQIINMHAGGLLTGISIGSITFMYYLKYIYDTYKLRNTPMFGKQLLSNGKYAQIYKKFRIDSFPGNISSEESIKLHDLTFPDEINPDYVWVAVSYNGNEEIISDLTAGDLKIIKDEHHLFEKALARLS